MALLRLLHGDCRDRMLEFPDGSVGAFIMDPPYDIAFMGKEWDSTGVCFDIEFWKLVRRKLQVGGVIKSFGATRTYHRKIKAMREAHLRVGPLEAYCYGVGFPKSTNISKRIDRMAGAERQVVGYKRGVGGENLNDLVNGKAVRSTTDVGAKGVGAYGTGAKQVAIDVPITIPATEAAKLWEGYGTAMKPAWEPVVVAYRDF